MITSVHGGRHELSDRYDGYDVVHDAFVTIPEVLLTRRSRASAPRFSRVPCSRALRCVYPAAYAVSPTTSSWRRKKTRHRHRCHPLWWRRELREEIDSQNFFWLGRPRLLLKAYQLLLFENVIWSSAPLSLWQDRIGYCLKRRSAANGVDFVRRGFPGVVTQRVVYPPVRHQCRLWVHTAPPLCRIRQTRYHSRSRAGRMFLERARKHVTGGPKSPRTI